MKRIISTKTASPLEIDSEKTKESWLAIAATFVIPAVLVIGLLFLLISFRGGIEAGVANLALLLPVGYAFAAGMVASVNPCGVLMLPTYVLQQLRTEGRRGLRPRNRTFKALLIAVVVTAGFFVVFAAVGGIIAAGGRWLVEIFPYAGLVIGAAMVGLGAWILVTGKTLSILGAGPVTANRQQSLGNAFLFGIAYAVGSLSCTLPIFLVVVGTSLTSEGLLFSFGQFIGYALGMGTIIFTVTIGVALFRRAMVRWLRLVTPYIHRVTAMFLIGAGAYLIYYWLFLGGLAS
jgi:cytochrome c biogenesis protein CcdA